MKTTTKWLAAFSAASMLIFSVACNKDNSTTDSSIPPGKSKVSVFMSDAPVNFYKVLVDIRQVAVKIDTSKHQGDEDNNHEWDENGNDHRDNTIWDTLSITPGVYNLLDLRNGVDTLLGSAIYPSGKILKVRITLGSDNTIYTDSLTSYPLVVFGPHPYFDINVRREHVYSVSNNEFQLWLDFNLHRSIFFWNGTFLLKPYIVAFNNHACAKIHGRVLPDDASPLVELYNDVDTVYAVPNRGGNYMIRGVNPGTYSLYVMGHHGYNDTTVNNIVVNSNATVQTPTITLHK